MVLAKVHIFIQRKREETLRTRIPCSILRSMPGFSFEILYFKKKETERKKQNVEGASHLMLSDGFTYAFPKNIPCLVTLYRAAFMFSCNERIGRSYIF